MRNTDQDVAAFIDVNNLYHNGRKKYEKRLDYKLFSEELAKHGHLQVAYAYGISDDEGAGSFKALLRHAGFECRWEKAKYNWNVGISMDVIRQLEKVDLVIIGSGDMHLTPCVEYVKQQGVKCYVYGFRISGHMRRAADRYFEIQPDLMIQEEQQEVQ